MKIMVVLSLLFLTSCFRDNLSPEAALRDFVESGAGSVMSRSFVLERVTGKMQQSFENMEEADFQKYADMRNIKTESFKVLSKSCQEKKCFVTYSIGYVTKKDDKKSFNTEVKKIAEIVKIDNKWLIADVSNIKTYHEALEPINPLE